MAETKCRFTRVNVISQFARLEVSENITNGHLIYDNNNTKKYQGISENVSRFNKANKGYNLLWPGKLNCILRKPGKLLRYTIKRIR